MLRGGFIIHVTAVVPHRALVFSPDARLADLAEPSATNAPPGL